MSPDNGKSLQRLIDEYNIGILHEPGELFIESATAFGIAFFRGGFDLAAQFGNPVKAVSSTCPFHTVTQRADGFKITGLQRFVNRLYILCYRFEEQWHDILQFLGYFEAIAGHTDKCLKKMINRQAEFAAVDGSGLEQRYSASASSAGYAWLRRL